MTEKKDIFYLDKVFPEADKIFSENFKSAEEIIRNAIVVLDTNVLLVPFDTNEKNVIDIKNIYLKHKSEGRLFLPARVAREFANNRANRIGEVFLQLRQIKESLNSGNFKINKYPILENNSDYKELLKHFESIQKSIKSSRKHLDNIEMHIQSWTWNDNVSQSYKEIFTPDVIIEVKMSQEELEKNLAFRIEHRVAPGYKDNKKLDDGIGDLVIWQTILEIGKDNGRDVIFVTNDQKNDWFYKQDKIGLYPKFELFDEFRRYTNGKSIAIINFIKFLELSHARAETIEEIKTTIEESFSGDFRTNLMGLTEGMIIEHARFGKGQIVKMMKSGMDDVAHINFTNYGIKTLLVKFAPMRLLETQLNFIYQNPEFDNEMKSKSFDDNSEKS